MRQELQQLQTQGHALAGQLLTAADQLLQQGRLPAASLLVALDEYAGHYQNLLNLTGMSARDGVTLSDLEQLLATRDCRESAERVATQLAQLAHVDVRNFAPLDLCQREAGRLCTLAAEADGRTEIPELHQLRHGTHPLNSLLRLCDEGQELSDAEWNQCYDDVVANYGRQLATALTRGRIQRLATSAPVRTPEITAAPLELSAPAPAVDAPETAVGVAPVSNDPLLIFDSPSVSVFDDSPSSPALPTAPLVRAAIRPPEPLPPTGPVDPVRPERMRSPADPIATVNRLLADGRIALAQHLVRLEELRTPQSVLPPSWLLRAIVLGRHLSYSRGEIARQLDEELKEFRTDQLSEGPEDRQRALAFYLRAAALPATLLAGSAAGAAILRSFRIAPGFSQIYNYCSRIALSGDRLASNLIELVRPAGRGADPAELAQLSQTASDWLEQTARRVASPSRSSPLFLHAHWTVTSGTAIRHAEATMLWCKWQETLLLASRLLRPVREQADAERNWVRQEISRLTSQIRVEPCDGTRSASAATSAAARGIVLPLEEMQSVLLEAVALANRWLRLGPLNATRGAAPIPVETLELRDEILGRSPAVLAELDQHESHASSSLVKSAIACCRDAVQQIQQIFAGTRPLPLVETDPRHVLNAELLKFPGLELNAQWLPVGDAISIESELLNGLGGTELSWRQCYDFHARAGHHDATGHLIELDVWDSPDERASLRELRQSQIGQCRTAIAGELEELGVEIRASLHRDSWTAKEAAALQTRFERIRQESSRGLNFAVLRRQIYQMHSAIQRNWKSDSPDDSPTESGGRPFAAVSIAAPSTHDIFSEE